MLMFVDQTAHVKVFRLNPSPQGDAARSVVGAIRKKDLTTDIDLGTLAADERQQLEKIVAFYKNGERARNAAALYGFPEQTRMVVDYCAEYADAFERQTVIAVMTEALRVLKKSGRQASSDIHSMLQSARL